MRKRYNLNFTKFLNEVELSELKTILTRYPGRDAILLKLALSTGGRAMELLNLKKCDLNDIDRSVLIQGLKGSNDRTIPLPNKLYRDLKEYAESHTSQKVFPISYSSLVRIWHLYRPVKKKFHCLRHTFAIETYKKTKDIRLVQLALGHRNIQNTEIYMDFLYNQSELRRLLVGRDAA